MARQYEHAWDDIMATIGELERRGDPRPQAMVLKPADFDELRPFLIDDEMWGIKFYKTPQ